MDHFWNSFIVGIETSTEKHSETNLQVKFKPKQWGEKSFDKLRY